MTQRLRETLTVLRNGEAVPTGLDRIAERARTDSKAKFDSLIHHLNEDLLRECFGRLSRSAAPGIDRVTKDEYAKDLEANIANLLERLKQRGYHPQPVRRKLIPKDGSSKMRPLGIPALEDKLVQSAITCILERIYEQDFLDCSYGFRPGRGCHDALRELDRIIHQKVSYVVDADIRGFFDHVDHDWMMKFLRHRISDTPLLQLIQRFLKAGVMDEGILLATEEGVPQGGSISPILANVYLHYTLDLWFERIVRKRSGGQAFMVRYADDFVVCFQHWDDAKRFYEELQVRLAKFGLSIATEKTRIIQFGRFAAENAARRDGSRPSTFDFLGFTHYCGVGKDGRFAVKRRTSRKKYKAKVAALSNWLRDNRHRPLMELGPVMAAKLLGHFRYYGVNDNWRCLSNFLWVAKRLLFKWLNRRSNRTSYNWEQFSQMLKYYPLPEPRIYVNLYSTSR